MIQIGDYTLSGPAVLAPMAGITDAPFRSTCRRYGAAAATAEMLTANCQLWHSRKSSNRLPDAAWPEPRIVQIAGSEAKQMADAALRCADSGAQIIDINMGCPAKKVCRRAAGSALLKHEALVAEILISVVRAVSIPVTLKIRTGWDQAHRNAVTIAAIAQDAGIQALVVHGRTRACLFNGDAEYDTIAAVVRRVEIPVFANGDIESPAQAKRVLKYTGAAGIMIGRGAQGQPWLFGQINQLLRTGQVPPAPGTDEVRSCIVQHLAAMRDHYPENLAVRLARKHVNAYFHRLGWPRLMSREFNILTSADAQEQFIATHVTTQNNNKWDQAA